MLCSCLWMRIRSHYWQKSHFTPSLIRDKPISLPEVMAFINTVPVLCIYFLCVINGNHPKIFYLRENFWRDHKIYFLQIIHLSWYESHKQPFPITGSDMMFQSKLDLLMPIWILFSSWWTYLWSVLEKFLQLIFTYWREWTDKP